MNNYFHSSFIHIHMSVTLSILYIVNTVHIIIIYLIYILYNKRVLPFFWKFIQFFLKINLYPDSLKLCVDNFMWMKKMPKPYKTIASSFDSKRLDSTNRSCIYLDHIQSKNTGKDHAVWMAKTVFIDQCSQ